MARKSKSSSAGKKKGTVLTLKSLRELTTTEAKSVAGGWIKPGTVMANPGSC